MQDDSGQIVVHGGGMSPLLRLAIENKVDVAALEKLVELHERVAAREAAKEFADAMARFQAACPAIPKSSTATVTTKSGGQYRYKYAELDEIARTVRPHLHGEGLSYSWDSVVSDDGKRISVTCTIAHANGHKVTATFASPTAAVTSSMSPQQEVAAALTFGRRQSLIEALGLTTTDPDNEVALGNGAGPSVTRDQVLDMEALIDQCPPATRDRMLAYVGVKTLEEIPQARYAGLMADLAKKANGVQK